MISRDKILNKNLLDAGRFWDVVYNTEAHMRFRLDTRLLSGEVLTCLPEIVAEFGDSAVLFADRAVIQLPLFKQLCDSLRLISDFSLIPIDSGEPTEQQLFALKEEVLRHKPDFFIAVGGGSVLDRCKALRTLLNQNSSSLKTAFSHEQLAGASLVPLIAIPTTAATGAEVSRYVVIHERNGRKRGFRSWNFCPEVAVVDYRWIVSLSDKQIITGAVDILAHCYEAYVSQGERSMITDQFCLSGMKMAIDASKIILNGESRTDSFYYYLSRAATLGGIVLSNVRLGLIHGCGEALASYEKINHGHSLALFLEKSVQCDVPFLIERFEFARNHLQTSTNNFRDYLTPLFQLIEKFSLNKISPQNDIKTLVSGITESVINDHVLSKESPKPLPESSVHDFVKQSLNSGLTKEDKQVGRYNYSSLESI